MAEKNADIFAKYGLSSPQSSPKSPGGDVFTKYGLSAPAPKERSIIDEIKSHFTGDFPEVQPRSRDEFARDVIDGVGDGIARIAKPIGDYVVKPVLGALDYVDAPVRQATKVYQDQPESLQFSPKGLIQPVMSGAKFAFDELRGRKTPADAPSFDELYKRTDIGRTLNNPAIAGPAGKFLLSAPGPDVPDEYDINAKELMGRDYDATALEVGRKANELVGGGLLQAAMPSNLLLSAAPKALEKAKLARDAFKAAGREALAAEKAEQAVTPQIRRAGIIDDVPPGPQKPPEVPTISETQVDDARAATTPPEPLPPPESSAALEKYLEQAKGAGYNTDLPQAAELERAERVLGDLKHPILPAQRNATRDMNARDKFRALKESGTATGKQISEFEQLQRQEAVSKIDETINQASPSGVANPDPVAQAENLKKQFLETYENRRTQLGEAFNQYDNVSVDPLEHVPQLTDRIAQEIPGFEKFIESVSDEGVKLKPYSKKLGISRQEYNAISDVVTELGSGPVTVKELRNMRGALLREFPNPLDRPPVVNQLRKAMLNHLEEIIASKHPANREEIFKTFRDYAINEKNLDELEKVFGGSFSEIASGTSKGTVNEKVLDRIFANSRNATIAKNAMGEAAFNEAFASYLAQKRASLTKEGVFSSRRFANWLNTKRTVFQQAGVNPNTLDRLEALTTVLKFTADAPSVNPPGTAKTIGLLKAIGNNAEMPTSVGGILNSAKKVIAGTADDLRRQQGAARTFDELSGVETKGLLEKAGEKLVSPETRALTRKMKKAAKAKADELGKTAKDFIGDEEGKFSPEDLLNILKPGQENVFDLKKARGLVGEPKRGLLEPKDNPVAKYRPPLSREERADLLNWIDSAYNTLRRGEKFKPVDEQYLREVLPVAPDYQKKYVKDLLEQIEKQKTGLNTGEEVAVNAAKQNKSPDEFPLQLGSENKIGDVFKYKGKDHVVTYVDQAGRGLVKPVTEPKGLLTSLDVERGPVKELPEAGKLVDTVRENRGEQWVAGKRIGGIHKAELGPHAGKEFTLTGKTGEADEASNWNTLHEIKFKDGQSEWLTSDEIFHMTDPDSYRNPYVGRAKVGKYDAGPRSVIVDENGNSWRVAKVDQNSKMVTLNLERGGDLEKNIPNQITVPAKDLEKWETYGEYEGRKYKTWNNQQKAAEAERMKKGLIGVDFGGRGGKMPKEKAPTFPKDAKFQKNQEVTYDGRPAKVVQYDGNGVYTVKVGNSHQQVHMSELKIGKGKPKKKK